MNSLPLDPDSEAQDIDANCELEIVQDVKPPLKPSEIEKAMREVGMTRLNMNRWKAQTTLAEFMLEIGAIKVAVGEYAISNEYRMEAIQKCRRVMRKADKPMDVCMLATALAKMLDGKDKTTKETINAIEVMRSQTPEALSTSRMPPKGAHIIAVQVNNKS